MPKIILAFDSYKGSLSAPEACAAAARGVLRAAPDAQVIPCPLSDGGEGFAEALHLAAGGAVQPVPIVGPLFENRTAELVLLDEGRTAVVECAQACGLGLEPPERRSPMCTTSLGVGELILAAQRMGVTRIVVGLGGSATNDGGMGMLTALGWQFLDAQDTPLPPVGESLARVERIVPGKIPTGVAITAACDVTNPLYGPRGAAYTFAPQKGATSEEVLALDAGLKHFAHVCAVTLGRDESQQPGAGAAGGLGFALLAFLNADFQPGAELAIALSRLPEQLPGTALCFTGEGQTDGQTAYGKLPAAVATHCQAAGVPCVCLSGALGEGWHELYQLGMTAVFSITQRPQSLTEAIACTPEALADAAEGVCRLCARRQ